jgi:hypothetical protein
MKNLFTVMLLFVAAGVARAQFTKGTVMAGGSVGFSSYSSNYTTNGTSTPQGTTTSFTLVPQAGYFIQDNLVLGAGVSFNSSSYKPNGSSNSLTGSRILFSPFVRYYLPAKIYMQGTFDVGSSSSSSTGGGSVTNTLLGWSLLAGYPILLNDFVALEPQIGYSSLTNKTDSANKTVSGEFFIRFGFQIYLRKK